MTPLFVRVGWMTWYDRREEPDGPVGGGSFNDDDIGSEVDNFRPYRGVLRGYAQVPSAVGYNLARLGAAPDADQLDGVLVAIFATAPTGGERLVGWYRDATCYAEARRRSAPGDLYNFQTRVANAVLLPLSERTFRPPTRFDGGFGQANVRYPYDPSGKKALLPWMRRAISWIDRYSGPNLLDGGDPGVLPDSPSGGQGLEQDPAARRKLELHAMSTAIQFFRGKGYRVHDVSSSRPYDLLCVGPRGELRVEVKGTSTAGETVRVTHGEVRAARSGEAPTALFVLSQVKLTKRRGGWLASGGEARWLPEWSPKDRDLQATAYDYRVPSSAKKI